MVGITFSENVPEAVRTAVMNYKAPGGFTVAKVTKRKRPTITCFYGVRLDIGSGPFPSEPREQKFAFLASNSCRVSRTLIEINSGSTTGATQHLKETHEVEAVSSAKTTKW
ncbi:unnamed protein product [Hapterophycus canaliculatus]